ncbi:MAG: sigma-54-dependent Fis family transcriptional regulator, partial [Victivallales bacterium]|nr:sigma-54-dependent Fis family transcriptional regulator [Victivallales bacterium]
EAQRWGVEGFVSQSPLLREILQKIKMLEHADSVSVLVTGESGTGKELIARAVHANSARAAGPFLPINCATVPREMAESLVFGHKKGAFTGADADQAGYFDLADGGTLFLDEVGDMPHDLQVKLLRVLEDGQVRSLGAQESRPVDVRVVAATNADLQRRIQETAFRQDLYFRIARFTVTAPPLRQRREDIPLLTRHFLQILAAEMGREAPDLSPQALARLQDYPFPGN